MINGGDATVGQPITPAGRYGHQQHAPAYASRCPTGDKRQSELISAQKGGFGAEI